MPKIDKSFRFNPQTYAGFKELAAKNGYTTTGALEKFMADAVEYGLLFPSAKMSYRIRGPHHAGMAQRRQILGKPWRQRRNQHQRTTTPVAA